MIIRWNIQQHIQSVSELQWRNWVGFYRAAHSGGRGCLVSVGKPPLSTSQERLPQEKKAPFEKQFCRVQFLINTCDLLPWIFMLARRTEWKTRERILLNYCMMLFKLECSTGPWWKQDHELLGSLRWNHLCDWYSQYFSIWPTSPGCCGNKMEDGWNMSALLHL